MTAESESLSGPSEPSEAEREGLPWEREEPGKTPVGGFQTVRMVLFAPAEAFRAMRRTGGLSDPLLFLVVFGTIGVFFGLLWQSTTRTLVSSLQGVNIGEIAAVNTLGLVWLLAAPLLLVLLATLRALVYHGCLMLFGGAPQPLETTFRVVAYASASAGLWAVVPFCGGVIGLFYDLVVCAIGLAQAHEVPGGRAAAAVIVPFVAFCFCCALAWLMIVGTALSLAGLNG